MKNLLLYFVISLVGCSLCFAGIEGVYWAADEAAPDMSLRLLPDCTATFYVRTPRNPTQGQTIIGCHSTGKWALKDGKVQFQGDALIETVTNFKTEKTERKPLVITLSVETNGDLLVIPNKDVLEPTRLSKQEE